jgi:hypothetical protein
MAPYLQKALRQFDNIVPTHRHDFPYPHIEPKYGAKQQYAEYDTSVIGHGIVGEDIPIMARLAKARRWSKR